ncbi:class I SAM-dependent methyltransferase [Dyella choica]|uniref:class I SAM-dependent methyltransferase n=1 Tax=Dyella choica TaxID=1927959 RepID=UPI001315636B|nr:class I SAM-dependent methyltransferase [Dyella choica]
MDGSKFRYSATGLLESIETSLANYNRWIVSRFIREFRRHRYQSVLDFGAGIGSLAVLFKAMTGVTPLTLEVDGEQRAMLSRRGFSPVASIDQLPGDIDMIYTSNVLEHIPDDIAALRELRDHLAPGGRIFIFVPAFPALWTTVDDKVGHVRRYTKAALRQSLDEAGLKLESIRYTDPVGFLLVILFKLVGSQSGVPSDRSYFIFDRLLFPVSRLLDWVTSPFFGRSVFAVASKGEP